MNPLQESGYQAIRLATELFPATLAAATQAQISPVWCILGYFLFLFFAIGQLCAMWKPIAEALGNSMSAVLLSCVTGLLLAMPLVTESGISIIHFFDVILGGSWCVLLLWVAHIFCVFLVRGRPYTGDVLVQSLKLSQTLAAFVALAWNVVLPFGLMALCVLEYKSSGARDLYQWRSGRSYWSVWVRKCGGFMQMACLLVAPITAIIQIYRYLSNGPPDILDVRIRQIQCCSFYRHILFCREFNYYIGPFWWPMAATINNGITIMAYTRNHVVIEPVRCNPFQL